MDGRRRRMHRRDRRRDPAGAQRLALRGRQDRRAGAARRQPRGRKRAAVRLCESGRRPGRADLRRRLVRAGRRSRAQGQARLVPRGGGDRGVPPRGKRLGMPAGRHRARAQRHRIDLPGDDAGPARLCEQDRLSLGGDRPVGRRRFGAHRRRSRRRAGPRPRAHADDALALYQRPLAGGRQGLRPGDRHPLRHRRHRARDGCVPRDAAAACSATARKMSRRKTYRAAPAALP